MSLLQKRSGWIPPLFPVQGLYSFFSLLFFLFFKHRTVSISCIRPDGKLIRSETASKRLRQGIGRLLFVSIFSNSFLFFPGANLAYIGERTEPRWEIPADIIARSWITKRYVTKLMGKKKKPCREYRAGKDTPSIVPRMLERVHQRFTPLRLPIVKTYRENWKQFQRFPTIDDLFRREGRSVKRKRVFEK